MSLLLKNDHFYCFFLFVCLVFGFFFRSWWICKISKLFKTESSNLLVRHRLKSFHFRYTICFSTLNRIIFPKRFLQTIIRTLWKIFKEKKGLTDLLAKHSCGTWFSVSVSGRSIQSLPLSLYLSFILGLTLSVGDDLKPPNVK